MGNKSLNLPKHPRIFWLQNEEEKIRVNIEQSKEAANMHAIII